MRIALVSEHASPLAALGGVDAGGQNVHVAALAAALARKGAEVVVHTFHALGSVKRQQQGAKDTSPPCRVAEERRIARRADRIVCTSTSELFELGRMGAPAHRVSVVPCGVDLDLFSPEGPAWPRRPGLARLVVVSRLVERKGIGHAIAALAAVPDAELLGAGGPERARLGGDPEARRLMELARSSGVVDRVQFLGRVGRRELPSLLRSADVVLAVPWYEPFGIVPLEAMACGVPVVATAVGGLVDTVVDGVTGLHVPPRRPDLIASATRALLADDQRRRELGRHGARRARERYGWGHVAGATLDVYRALVPGVAAPRRGALG